MSQCNQCMHEDFVGSCGHAVHLNATGGYDCLICSLARVKVLEAEKEAMRWAWSGMESAPKDGSTFLIRYPNQGNVLDLCYWVKIHNQWRSRGVLVFPDIQGCEWFPLARIAALSPQAKAEEGKQ